MNMSFKDWRKKILSRSEDRRTESHSKTPGLRPEQSTYNSETSNPRLDPQQGKTLSPSQSPDNPISKPDPVPGFVVRAPTERVQDEHLSGSNSSPRQDLRRLSAARSTRPSAALTGWSHETSPESIHYEHSSKPAPSVASGPMEDEIMPETVQVRVYVSFSRWDSTAATQVTEWVSEWDPKTIHSFRWREGNKDFNHYHSLIPTDAIGSHMRKHRLKGHDSYIKYGSCCVKGPSDLEYDRHYKIIDDYEKPQELLRQEVIKQICGFINEHAFRSFTLDVHWEYSSACLTLVNEPDSPTRIAEGIKWELKLKMHKNFEDENYIPKSDLDKFLTKKITDAIINDDIYLRRYLAKEFNQDKQAIEKELNDFRKKIHSPSPGAAKLLLLCVHENIDMTYLKHWQGYHGFSDTNLRPTVCADAKCVDGKLSSIKDKFPSFFALTITEVQGLWTPGDKILPVKFAGDPLGDGNAGRVHPVIIDPSHHAFSADPKCQFALKEFDGNARSQDAFSRELSMLQIFSGGSNPHLVMHITAWRSRKNKNTYILYPKAKYHLGTMLHREPVNLDRDGVLWFLRQVKGLAGALDSIHYWSKSKLSDKSVYNKSTSNSVAPDEVTTDETYEEKDLMWCSHQDIKPENILVFEKLDNQHPILKLSDLGSGYFNLAKGRKDISEGETQARGTYTYFAPDLDRDGLVSRPFDMWALGCCYLELLLWLFDIWTDRQFSRDRIKSERTMADQFKYDMYWVKEASGRYDLRTAVTEALRLLSKKHCVNMPAFLQLVDIIKTLFHLNSKDRPTSTTLCQRLEELYKETETELNQDSDRYLKQYRVNHPERQVRPPPKEPPPRRSGHSPSPSQELQQMGHAATLPSLRPPDSGSREAHEEPLSPERMVDDLEVLESQAQQNERLNN